MRTFTRFAAILSFLGLSYSAVIAQNYSENQAQLQKYESDELYDNEAKHDVSGKWVGTEIQYDETGTFIKVKFDIVFEFEQDGLRLLADPIAGQKTGYFLDQRLNRKLTQSFVRGGEEFLDLFCYTGAFGAYALQAGVATSTYVDGSERALSLVKQVVLMNGFEERARYVKTDIFDWLKDVAQQYDIVSLDPPALAKSRSKATVALRAYRDLNARAMKWVKPGGLLLTSSCSGLISRVNWRKALEEAAFKSRRTVRFLAFGTQAPDHPVLAAMPETEYLKFAVAQVL